MFEPVIRLPGNGLANEQGLYQLAFVFTLVGQDVRLGLLAVSGDPPDAKGSRTRIALALPPFAVLILGETVNGVPVCAAKVRLVDQPPTSSSVQPELFRNRRPLPKGN